MTAGSELFHQLILAPELEKAVALMSSAELRAVWGFLIGLRVETGIPGLLYGLVLCEAAARFMRDDIDDGGAE